MNWRESSPLAFCGSKFAMLRSRIPTTSDQRKICQNLAQLDSGNTTLSLSSNETALGGLNIGGFSDAVFNVVASYLGDDAGRFVAEVESIEL